MVEMCIQGRYDSEAKFVGSSPAVQQVRETIRLVAQSGCNPVLILGETGTGKEVAARVLHDHRHGTDRKFVAVNCAALSANLLESELFGHARGAFTGADRDKVGLFELAGEGTIFLDEISEMPLELQAKLLRVLQERSFRRVGGTSEIPCRATVIATSNRDLRQESAQGLFRKDLYYRLAVFPIHLPPLRHDTRRQDIPELADHFLRTSPLPHGRMLLGFTDGALQALVAHDWPGNVRELRNVIERAVILERQELVTRDSVQLPDAAGVSEAPETNPLNGPTVQREPANEFSLEAAEREFILRALAKTNWQRSRAAQLLGITRATLHSKLKRYRISPPLGPVPFHCPPFPAPVAV